MTIVTGELLEFLVTGRTHVLERNGKPAHVYLATDGTGRMRLDDGAVQTGRWRLTEDGYSTEWDSGRSGDWQLDATDGGLDYLSRDGKQRLKMTGLFFGDAEGLSRQ